MVIIVLHSLKFYEDIFIFIRFTYKENIHLYIDIYL